MNAVSYVKNKQTKKKTGNCCEIAFWQPVYLFKKTQKKQKKNFGYLGGIFHLADMLHEQFASSHWKVPVGKYPKIINTFKKIQGFGAYNLYYIYSFIP